ncbi:MAG: DNA adenine methylase [Elusimicrobia bacterium]|nr:DNA adenine methylase [Elusimicrobiota bacterium]
MIARQLMLLNPQAAARVKSPFRYPGGKFYAIKYMEHIWNQVPHDEYREPFVGGGQVFFSKEKVRFNWLNDIFVDLINAYQVIQDDSLRPKLISLLNPETADKVRHAEMKEWGPQDSLSQAYRFYYLNRTSYSGIMKKPAWGYAVGKSAPPKSWEPFITSSAEKLRGVKLTSLDFEEVIMTKPQGRKVFIYLDPPYIEADQTRAYVHSFRMHDHERLAKVLQKTRHKFLLSYDDCETARKLYSWAHLSAEEWWYNTANVKTVRKKGKELLITNFI